MDFGTHGMLLLSQSWFVFSLPPALLVASLPYLRLFKAETCSNKVIFVINTPISHPKREKQVY